jgi:hypothetical protein
MSIYQIYYPSVDRSMLAIPPHSGYRSVVVVRHKARNDKVASFNSHYLFIVGGSRWPGKERGV